MRTAEVLVPAIVGDIWVHYGFTGTGMWISPRQRRWVVMVTNKLYCTRLCQPLTDIRNAFRAMAFRRRSLDRCKQPSTTRTARSCGSYPAQAGCAALWAQPAEMPAGARQGSRLRHSAHPVGSVRIRGAE